MMRTAMAGLVGVLAWAWVAPAAAGTIRSTDLVAELTALMSQRGVEAVAAADPETEGRFVAALVIPKVQLLVVDARFPEPERLHQLIAAGDYRGAYQALQQQGDTQDKIFLQDFAADGLRGASSGGFDVLFQGTMTQTVFDGEPESRKLTPAVYEKSVTDADALYARLLTMLLDQLKVATAQ